jgi:flagellar hook-length control protein FliK
MLTLHPTTPRPAPSESTHAAAPGAAPQDPAGFASLLRQSQGAQPLAAPPARATAPVAAAKPAAPADAAAPPEPAADTAEATAQAEPAAPREAAGHHRAAPRSKQPAANDTALPRGAGTHAVAAAADAEQHSEAPAEAAAPTATTIDPAMLHWLAGLQREAPALGKATAATTTATATATTATDDAASTVTATPRDVRPAPLEARTDDTKDALRAAADQGSARGTAMTIEPVASKPAPDAFIAGKDTVPSTPLTTAVAAPPAPRHEAPAALTVAIATPLDAPDFPSALGLQLSVFARDGIQQAELQLNPAEMGPVSVQITMDGTQARVDFGADLAATRHVIEAGLPELASALRDAGFTLAGGGVSQHSQGRGDRGDPSGRGGRREPASSPAANGDDLPRVTRATVRLGGLDLYA